MKIAIGMDLHSKMAAVHAVYAGGGEVKEKEKAFLNGLNKDFAVSGSSPADMKKLAERLRGHDAHILIENSTKSHETYWVLTHTGINVVVAVAADLYRITKSVKKTDRNDSIELAGYMRRRLNGENEFSECFMPPLEWMLKRELCRTIFWEKLHLANLKRRTRAHILLHGITLSREYPDIFCIKAMEETDRLKDPCLRINNSEARSIKKRTDQEARLIETMFKNNTMFSLIHSIPGFGLVSSAYLTSMIIDIERFPSKEKFTAYFDIVPKMRSSASSNPNCSTTHRGDEDARRLICQAAMVHIRVTDSVVSHMYHRLRKNGKAHKEALVACGRKLMTVVWSVLKNGRPFTEDPNILTKAAAEEEKVEEEMTL